MSSKSHRDQEFASFIDRGGKTYYDLEFVNCRFVGCSFSGTRKPRRRSTLRGARFEGCVAQGCTMYTGIIEDALINGLDTRGQLLQTWAAVFRHVVLRGDIGRIMISPTVLPGIATPAEQQAFDEANAQFYAATDWALDISEARFRECQIRGVPTHLIRRDPASQVVVKRDKVISGEWRDVDLSDTWWHVSIGDLIGDDDREDVLLVAPKRHPNYRALLVGLQRLRDAGIAEPD